MSAINDPKCKPGDIVVIDKLDTIDMEVIDYQSNYKVFMDNINADSLYGVVIKITERDDDDYYIEGQLLNFSVKEKPATIGSGFGRPYTSTTGPSNQLVYSERTSAMFKKLSDKNARKIRNTYLHWFV